MIDYFLTHLKVIDNKWVFDDFESAWNYAETFMQINLVYFCGIESAVMHRAVGDCLKYALSKGYVSKIDFYKTDSVVLNKIVSNLNDSELRKLFARMNNKTKYVNHPSEFALKVYCKSRMIDPLFTEQGKIYRFSDKYGEWKKTLARESQPKEYFLKFMD